MDKIKCASFFAGVGGIDLGFKDTGFFETIYANELDSFAVQTYEKNFDTKVVCKDINLVETKDIPDFDVMLGGFPCLTGDSLVPTKDGYKNLIDIKPGDMVLSRDNKYHEVVRFMDQGIKTVYKISGYSFNPIKATGNHKFLVKRKSPGAVPEWLSVNELDKPDETGIPNYRNYYFSNLNENSYIGFDIGNIELLPNKENVYDIEVKDSHSFIVNGCITHNCQAFSIAGKKEGFNDSKGRGELFFQLERIFKEKQPKIIFLENVKNLLSHDNGNTFKVILNAITNAGYHVKYKVLNASKYGNIPQGRERIYIVGFKNKQVFNHFDFPEEIPLTTTLHDIIDFKSKIDDKYYYTPEKYSFYDTLEKEIISMDTTYQWRRSSFVRENKKNICFTLTASMGTGGHEVPLVLTETGIRKLTPRECFSLQGFPDTFIFPDLADMKLYKQAGNSVVVPVIERIAKQIEMAIKTTE